jgi:hypothetical protein
MDETEDMVKESTTHLVIGTENILNRAWCIFEILMRKEAGLFSQIIRCQTDEGRFIPQLQAPEGMTARDFLVGLRHQNFFDDMEAYSPDDRERIRARLKEAFGNPHEVNTAVVGVLEGQEGYVPTTAPLRALQGAIISVLAWVASPLALLLILVTLLVWAVSALGKAVRVAVRSVARSADGHFASDEEDQNKRLV